MGKIYLFYIFTLLSIFLISGSVNSAASYAATTQLSGSSGGSASIKNGLVYLASSATVSGSSLDGALVSITENFVSSEDKLGIDGNVSGTSGTISYSYDSTKGILKFSGSATVSTYQALIRKVTYWNTSSDPNVSQRKVKISLSTAIPFSNGHFYDFKTSSGITWKDAKTAAEALDYFGLKGYLATITSVEENNFCASKLAGQGWIGASDEASEGTWKWVTGPEAGNSLSYDNWASGEPNDAGSNEDFAHFLESGEWNDYPNSNGSEIAGYVVEFGGTSNDPVIDITDEVSVDIQSPEATAATHIESYSFTANWTAISGITNYYIDVATDASFTNKVSGFSGKSVGDVTSYQVQGLSPLTTYYYRIKVSSDQNGFSANSMSLTTLQKTELTGSTGGTAKTKNELVYIASSATITSTTLDGAIVSIDNNFSSGQDVLGIDGVQSGSSGAISYSYDSSKGILTLTGDATAATYQTILRKVTYTNTSATPSTALRSITLSLNKALPYSGNGHFYEFVSSSGITWTSAKAAAEGLNYFGLKGYLATITSAQENDFCTNKLSGDGWMGASDTDVEGTWEWVTGPEAGQTFSYTNWNVNQPDNFNGAEDYAQFYVTGKWNDLPNSESSIVGYVVEYGGMAGDPVLDISDEVTVNVEAPVASSATNIAGTTFKANWGTVSGATNYYLDVATDNSFTNFVTGFNNKNVGNVTSYVVNGLSAVTTYYYRVRATSGGFNSSTISLTTTKYDQTISFGALSSKVYGDADFNPSAIASSGLSVTYSTSDSNVATVVGGLIHIVGAGTCTVYADQAGNTNYFSAGQVSQTLTVNKAELTVTADPQTKIYGDANPTLTFQYSGWKNSEGESVLDIKPVASTTVNSLTNVGTYTNAITISGGSDRNYSFTYVPANFEVTKAMLTVTADPQTKIYGDANPTLTFQYSGWKNSDGESVLDTKPTASTTVTNTTSVGTYSDVITVSGGSDNNYAFSFVPADFEVTAATLTVTADAQIKIYGDANPALTFQYSGWKNSESDAVLDTKPTASTTVTNTTYVGTYSDVITVSGGSDNNYAFSFVPADFEVTAATLTVTADAKSKIYGDQNPVLTFEYSGWKNDDDEKVLDTKPTVATIIDLMTNAGIYTNAITVSGGIDNNYNFTYKPADFEVTKALLTVTADNKTKVYRDENPTLTYQYSGWKNEDSESDIDTKPVVSTDVDIATNVGTYPINVKGADDNNYQFDYTSGIFEVTKVMLTVTADPKTKIYGDENPELTFEYDGWKNNETETVLDVKPIVSTIVDLETSVGTYSIIISGGSDNNYDFTYIPANFGITKSELTVIVDSQVKKYGDENPELTIKYEGWKNEDAPGDLTLIPQVETTVDNLTPVGIYANSITAFGGIDENYSFKYIPATFEVTKAKLTVIANNLTKAYGEKNPELILTWSGWKNGDYNFVLEEDPIITTKISETTTPGIYEDAIEVYGAKDDNYEISYIQGDFEVTKGILYAKMDPKSKEYGQENPKLTYSYSGFVNGESELDIDTAPIPTTTVQKNTDAGIYENAISIEGGNDDHYIILPVKSTFTVLKAKQTITFNEESPRTYGDLPFVPNAKASSGLNLTFTVNSPELASVSNNQITLLGVGTVSFTAAQEGNQNYEAATATGTINVAKKAVTIEGFYAKSKEYDGNSVAQLSSGTLSGVVNSDQITLQLPQTGTFSQTKAGNSIPVSAAISISGEKANYYNLSIPELKADITPKVINVTVQNVKVECSKTEQPLKYTFEPSLLNGDSFTGELTRQAGKLQGTYPILLGTLSLSSNYSINFKGADYVIYDTMNLPPVVDNVADQKANRNSKQLEVKLTGIDPVSGCSAQSIDVITATSDNLTLVPSILVDYVKGETTATLKINLADNQSGDTKITVKIKDNGGVENGGIDTKDISFNLHVEFPTGIADINYGIDAKVYPNPSNGYATVECIGFIKPSMRIFNITGEEIFKKVPMDGLTQSLDLNQYGPGIYLIEISEGTKIITKKLTIKN